jgi:hypothetical protein
MANLIFNSAKVDLQTGKLDLENHDIKMMLVTASYTPNASHSKRSDITSEVSGDGYTAGGKSLTGKSVVLSGSEAVFNSDPVEWLDSSITARGAVLYRSRGGAASADELVCYYDFGSNFTSVAASFKVTPNVAGLMGLDEA